MRRSQLLEERGEGEAGEHRGSVSIRRTSRAYQSVLRSWRSLETTNGEGS
jgi:hypothetical protein